MSFLKKGAAAHQEMEKADLAQESAFGVRRFWLTEGKEGKITFLDGDLEGGLVKTVSFYEHMVPRHGKKGYDNFCCTQELELCPICEQTDSTPSLVFAFTILDHAEYKDKAGKIYAHQKRLFVCKRQTMKLLQLKAVKKDGLTGCTFEVSRIGEKSASVGSDFEFVAKTPIPEIANELGLKPEDLEPYNYEEVLNYRTAAELRKMGFGVSSVGSAEHKALGGEKSASQGTFGSKKSFNPASEM